MSQGTTQIDQLPIANIQTTTPNQPPVQASISDPNQNVDNVKIQNYGQQLNMERSADPGSQVAPIDYTSQLSSALKEASASGATVLPSRDIPQQTLPMQHDVQTKPDFVPETKTNDYIGDLLDKEKIIREQKQRQNHNDNLDYIYQSLQLPVLVGIMYFLFQLPFIRKNLLTFLPNLFNKDGAPKLSGYIFNSVMFAGFYSLLVKGINYLQQ